MSTPIPNRRLTVFICYAHRDEGHLPHQQWAERLLDNLRPLFIEGDLQLWSDKDLQAGQAWQQAIEEQLRSARVAALLIGPAFLSSDYIREVELPVLLTKQKVGELKIVPAHVRFSTYRMAKFKYPHPSEGPDAACLADFQSANDPHTPLAAIRNRAEEDRVLVDIAQKIYEVAMQMIEPSRSEELAAEVNVVGAWIRLRQARRRRALTLISSAVLLAVVAAGLLYMFARRGPRPEPAPNPAPAMPSITKPQANELVGPNCTFEGETPYPTLRHYLVVAPPEHHGLGVVQPHPLTLTGSHWDGTADIGGQNDYGKEFTVRVFATDSPLNPEAMNNSGGPPRGANLSAPLTIRRAPQNTASPRP